MRPVHGTSSQSPSSLQPVPSWLSKLAWQTCILGSSPSRWDRARKSERSYLRDDKSRRQRVIHHRDCPPHQHQIEQSGNCTGASMAKGLIYSPDYGKVAFTVPGMPE